MGLKNRFNKMKNFLFDEEDEKVQIKKTSSKKIEEKSVEKADNDIEELYFEDEKGFEPVKKEEIKQRVEKEESKFDFPTFDDNDFAPTLKEEVIIPQKKYEEKKVPLYQGSKRRDEVKKFKPSPIISPIYGLLDEEGNKVSDGKRTKKDFLQKEEKSIDDVRKKAYGVADNDIENTIKRLSTKTIEEAEKDMEKEEKQLSRTSKKAKELKKEKITFQEDDEEDDMILPNVNFKEIDVDKEIKSKNKIEDDDDDTKEQDLFNLIDTMYSKEEKE